MLETPANRRGKAAPGRSLSSCIPWPQMAAGSGVDGAEERGPLGAVGGLFAVALRKKQVPCSKASASLLKMKSHRSIFHGPCSKPKRSNQPKANRKPGEEKVLWLWKAESAPNFSSLPPWSAAAEHKYCRGRAALSPPASAAAVPAGKQLPGEGLWSAAGQ